MTSWLITALGLTIVVVVLTDMFHTLANPGRLGWPSRTMLQRVWRLSRHSRLAGPIAMLAVAVVWGILAVLGWATVYWPHMEHGFMSASEHDAGDALLDALYVSLVTISTLGLGDIFPVSGWLRLLNPLEALFGFALLTVAVSWVLQVYPALARRRELALRLTHLGTARTIEVFDRLDSSVAHALLDGLATDVARVRIDLHDYPETYYFRESDVAESLPEALAVAHRLVEVARACDDEQVRHGGATLHASLDDLAMVLDHGFLQVGPDTRVIFDAYRDDHRFSRYSSQGQRS